MYEYVGLILRRQVWTGDINLRVIIPEMVIRALGEDEITQWGHKGQDEVFNLTIKFTESQTICMQS